MKFSKHATLVAAIVSLSACGSSSNAPGSNASTAKPATSLTPAASNEVVSAPAASTPATATSVQATPAVVTPPSTTQPSTTTVQATSLPTASPPVATPPPAATLPVAASIGLPGTIDVQALTVSSSGGQVKAFSSIGVAADSTAAAPTAWAVGSAPIKTQLSAVRSVRLLNGKYVLLGELSSVGQARILVSFDGDSWTDGTLPIATSTNIVPSVLWDVAYGNGRYVATATSDSGQAGMLESNDALIWRTVPQASLQGKLWTGIAFGNGTFVAASQSGDTATSADGINWTVQKTSIGIPSGANTIYPALQKVSFHSGLGSFVIGGNTRNEGSGDMGTVYVSTNGTSWAKRNTGYAANVIRVECSAMQCVAATSSGSPALLTSSDLVTWTRTGSNFGTSTQYALGIAKTSAGWIASGVGGLLLTSPDGFTWTKTATR
jgi:hypothetical protein